MLPPRRIAADDTPTVTSPDRSANRLLGNFLRVRMSRDLAGASEGMSDAVEGPSAGWDSVSVLMHYLRNDVRSAEK